MRLEQRVTDLPENTKLEIVPASDHYLLRPLAKRYSSLHQLAEEIRNVSMTPEEAEEIIFNINQHQKGLDYNTNKFYLLGTRENGYCLSFKMHGKSTHLAIGRVIPVH